MVLVLILRNQHRKVQQQVAPLDYLSQYVTSFRWRPNRVGETNKAKVGNYADPSIDRSPRFRPSRVGATVYLGK